MYVECLERTACTWTLFQHPQKKSLLRYDTDGFLALRRGFKFGPKWHFLISEQPLSLFELHENEYAPKTIFLEGLRGAYKPTNSSAPRQPEKDLPRHPMAADWHSNLGADV